MVAKVMRKWWWWLMKKEQSLSSRNTLGNRKTANSISQTSNVKMVEAGAQWNCGVAMMGYTSRQC